MSTTQATHNMATFRRLCEVVNTGDLELISKAIDEVVQPDVRNSTPLPVEATGAEALKQVWTMLLQAFPNLHITIEDLIAEGDTVAARHTVSGTQTGQYMGRPPTNKPVTYNEMFIVRFAGGRIAAIAGVVDVLSQMRQLGAIPTQ